MIRTVHFLARVSGIHSAFVPLYKSDPAELPYTNWLSYFQDIKVADLPLVPGTHDSATVEVSPDEDWLGLVGWLYAKTQNINIYRQLLLGIRFLDFRLDVTFDEFDVPNSIYLSHKFKSNSTLAQGLAQIKQYLQEYPSEFVYVYLRLDASHPLYMSFEWKRSYIQSVLLDSGLAFAQVDSEALKTVLVKDVAGKVILLTPYNSALPFVTPLTYVNTKSHYSVCDIYTYTSESAAKQAMAQCFPQIPSGFTSTTGVLTGFALDGQFNQLWPNLTSPSMNDWWFYNFQNTRSWQDRKRFPIGVFLIDFVNATYASVMLDFIMNFAYPYPYTGSVIPWKNGVSIFVSATSPHTNPLLSYILVILLINLV